MTVRPGVDCPCSKTPGIIPRSENLVRVAGTATCTVCGVSWKMATPEQEAAVARLIDRLTENGTKEVVWFPHLNSDIPHE